MECPVGSAVAALASQVARPHDNTKPRYAADQALVERDDLQPTICASAT
jgi:hypothetical protein